MKNDAFVKLVDEADSAYVDLDTFGITLVRGWREALLTPAPVKSYVTNNSRLEHGQSVIATSKYAKKDKRDVSISFFLEGNSQEDYLKKYESFLDKIAYSGQFCLKVPCLRRVFKLVYSQCSQFGDYGLKKGKFTIKFTESNPNDRIKL
jgi:hypothetical protein